MGLCLSSDLPLYALVTLRNGWGDIVDKGVVSQHFSAYSVIVTTMAGREFLASTSLVEMVL